MLGIEGYNVVKRRESDDVRSGSSPERGAALVEFAVLAPLLILLLFGIIEFAWIFSQNLDVRHGAREGARLAAVDELPASAQEVADAICDRMDTVETTSTLISVDATGDTIGNEITVKVQAPPTTLTGIMSSFIPASLNLTSEVVIRAEKTISFPYPITDQSCT